MNKSLFESPSNDMEAGVLRMMVSNANQQMSMPYVRDNDTGAVSRDYMIERTIPYRVAQLELSKNTRLKITVPGNSGLFAGMCINIHISSSSVLNKDDKRPIDPYLSGKYLVTAVRHIISPASYVCVAEICKDSGLMNYSGVNNSDPTWNSLVSGNQNNTN